MTLKTFIRDGTGSGHLAGVTHANELIVSGIGDNESVFNSMNVADIAFNFFIPLSTKNFFITSVLATTPAAATNIDIYEATSTTSTTISKQLLKIGTSSKTFIPITLPFGGFLKVREGFFVNAKTDNATVDLTIIGYYKDIHVHI